MKKLIVHIECDESEVDTEHLKNHLESSFEEIVGDHGDNFGWRFFGSLGEAAAWEKGDDSCPHCEGEGGTGVVLG